MLRYLTLALFAATAGAADPLTEYLRQHGKPPVEYVLSKLNDHRVVILGENHWTGEDTDLVTALIPELSRCGAALAVEFLGAEEQLEIDELVTAPAWNADKANALLRAQDWPYVQYRDLMRAVWSVNRSSPPSPVRLIALGAPRNFRARGIRYDEYMADHLVPHLDAGQTRVLAFVGMHHAFTRYTQVERRGRGRATEFMNRFGNMLWRRYGQDVFLIALHKPEWCGGDKPESRMCPPLGGIIDCAASALGRPVGFDVLGSPIAEAKFPQESFYVFGHPLLRLIDYTDGYVWTVPIDQQHRVDVIPQEEYAPDRAGDPDAVARWKKWTEPFARPYEQPGWADLRNWRRWCE